MYKERLPIGFEANLKAVDEVSKGAKTSKKAGRSKKGKPASKAGRAKAAKKKR